jgi:hypothetical protein
MGKWNWELKVENLEENFSRKIWIDGDRVR